MSLDDLKRRARKHYKRIDQELDIPAVVRESSDLPANKVRVYRTDIRQEAVVNGLIRKAGTFVYIREKRNHEYQIVDVDIPMSSQVFGATLPVQIQPPGGQEVIPQSIPGIGFKPLRLEPSQAGGTKVHVSEGAHSGGYWEGGDRSTGTYDPNAYDPDLAAYVPATSGTGWTRIYLDPAAVPASAILAAAGEVFVGATQDDLTESSAWDIPIPIGMYPIGAVALTNGQTVINTTTRFLDMRLHHAQQPAGTHAAAGMWFVDYASVIPSGLTMGVPLGVQVIGDGSLTISGTLYIV